MWLGRLNASYQFDEDCIPRGGMTTILPMNASPLSPSVWNRRFWAGLAFGLFLGASGALLAAWGVGMLRSRYHPIEEAKLCYAALTNPDLRLQPQTREYLKGRLYWNAAIWIKPSWLDDWHLDFGPVEEKSLDGLRFVKDASSADEVYKAALDRHPKSATSIYTW